MEEGEENPQSLHSYEKSEKEECVRASEIEKDL